MVITLKLYTITIALHIRYLLTIFSKTYEKIVQPHSFFTTTTQKLLTYFLDSLNLYQHAKRSDHFINSILIYSNFKNATTLFDHVHPIIIEEKFRFPKFISACKKSGYSSFCSGDTLDLTSRN